MLNPVANAFGLDIGDKSYKLAQLQHRQKGDYRLTALGQIDVPEGVMSGGEITDKKRGAELVSKLVKKSTGRVRGRAVVACLPEAKTFIKIIDAPTGQSKPELERAVLSEIEQNIPLPKEDIYYDWQLIRPAKHKPAIDTAEKDEKAPKKDRRGDTKKRRAETDQETGDKKEPAATSPGKNTPDQAKILLGAAPKVLVDDLTEMLDMAGLAPVALEIEATAISRCIIPSKSGFAQAVGILDIGATRSSLVIYDRGLIQMSISIPIAGTTITQTLSKMLNVSLEDAEILKVECGLDSQRCENKIWTVLQPLIDDMAQKIRSALRFYKIGFPQGKNIEQLYVCGGGAHFREIDSVLSRKLTIKVERADSTINLKKPLPQRLRSAQDLSYTTALGLGIRAADEMKNQVKLLL